MEVIRNRATGNIDALRSDSLDERLAVRACVPIWFDAGSLETRQNTSSYDQLIPLSVADMIDDVIQETDRSTSLFMAPTEAYIVCASLRFVYRRHQISCVIPAEYADSAHALGMTSLELITTAVTAGNILQSIPVSEIMQ